MRLRESIAERLAHIQYQIDDARLHGGMYSSTHVELEWLIEQAERAQKLSEREDAKILFVNNGLEEDQYVLQEENIQMRAELEQLCNEITVTKYTKGRPSVINWNNERWIYDPQTTFKGGASGGKGKTTQ